MRYAKEFSRFPELNLLSTVLDAVATRDVSRLLPLGSNAVQSAAQVLRLSSAPVRYSVEHLGKAELQGISILQLNGVNICADSQHGTQTDELSRFSSDSRSMLDLMTCKDPYIRELACLHGAEEPARHSATLDSAFYRDEQLAFDVLNQMSQSGYD